MKNIIKFNNKLIDIDLTNIGGHVLHGLIGLLYMDKEN